jgi:hypothetical protein
MAAGAEVQICRSIKQNYYCVDVTTKFSPLVKFAGISKAAVTRADCKLGKNGQF